MKTLKISLIIIIFCIFILMFIKITETNKINKFINNATVYLNNNVNKDGRFVYKRLVNNNEVVNPESYNIVRHCGVLYSLLLLEKYTNSTEIKNLRIKSAQYLIKNYLKQLDNKTYAVVSKKTEEKITCNKAKLGATGLALVGISDLYKDKIVDKDILIGLANFIISMQRYDGSFNMSYNYDTKEVIKDSESEYYPGEAILGLLYLNDIIPDEKWVSYAKKGLIYNAKNNFNFVHWDFLAIQKLMETPNNGLTEEDITLFRNYTKEMSKQVLANRNTSRTSPLYGAYYDNARPCSVATYTEGALAMYEITDDYILKYKLIETVKSQLHFIISTQILFPEYIRGGVPSNIDTSDKIVRIDNVQHSLSAMIDYLLLKSLILRYVVLI